MILTIAIIIYLLIGIASLTFVGDWLAMICDPRHGFASWPVICVLVVLWPVMALMLLYFWLRPSKPYNPPQLTEEQKKYNEEIANWTAEKYKSPEVRNQLEQIKLQVLLEAGSSACWCKTCGIQMPDITIQEAADMLSKHLNDTETFTVSVKDDSIVVHVNWIYRVNEVEQLGGNWKGFPLKIGRKSCW